MDLQLKIFVDSKYLGAKFMSHGTNEGEMYFD
jgi:hypothetical protein